MNRIAFVLNKGLGEAGSATRAMQFAGLAAEQGADVSVVLVDDAVHWAQLGMADGIRSTTGEQMVEMLKKLQSRGCAIHVCKACADKRLIAEDDCIPGARITGGGDIVKLMIDPAVKVITF
jgi:uncharacterized protein involved in oxidation of intracellular sulfur